MTCRVPAEGPRQALIGLFSETPIGNEIAFRREFSERKKLNRLNTLNGRFGASANPI